MLNFYSVSAVVSIQCSETGVDTIFNPKLASGIFLIKKRTVLNFSSILVFLKNLAGTWVEPYRFFSSVLRISSGRVRVWTHYDVMDNAYCQIVGHKKAVLWPPHEASRLYLDGEKKSLYLIKCCGAGADRSRYFLVGAGTGVNDILFVCSNID